MSRSDGAAADDPDEQLGKLRLKLLQQELRRYQLAARGLIAIAGLTLAFSIFATFFKDFRPTWELVGLWGLATFCVAVPLLSKFNLSKDGGGIEVGSPFDVLAKYEAKAEAARTAALKKTEQVIGGLAQRIDEIADAGEAASRSSAKPAAPNEGVFDHEPNLREVRKALPPPEVDDDSQKGRFGGMTEVLGRRLEARVEPSDLGKGWKRVVLTLRSTDGTTLDGSNAWFFLHDSFEPDAYRVKVPAGAKAVTFETEATGAFTAGVFAERGRTRLEVDLSEDPTLPAWFRNG